MSEVCRRPGFGAAIFVVLVVLVILVVAVLVAVLVEGDGVVLGVVEGLFVVVVGVCCASVVAVAMTHTTDKHPSHHPLHFRVRYVSATHLCCWRRKIRNIFLYILSVLFGCVCLWVSDFAHDLLT